MIPKIFILDTYYPDFLDSLTIPSEYTYDQMLAATMGLCFGTFDAYSRNLQALGWETQDVIANFRPLQMKWAWENQFGGEPSSRSIVLEQIERFKPDVVFCQDLSYFDTATLQMLRGRHLLVGQCSCPMPLAEKVEKFHALFTSFPHYIPIFERLGVRAVFNPLAFDPTVLQKLPARIALRHDVKYDVVFVGGVGTPSHWAKGMETLEAVARALPSARFYGYGYDLLPDSSEVKKKYCGPAWGLHMYQILCQSRIVLNRHGEVANGYSNNMRMFEATGCGALLLTEESKNIHDYFKTNACATYESPGDAVTRIRYHLDHWNDRDVVARRGQAQTFDQHTYSRRMRTVSSALKETLK